MELQCSCLQCGSTIFFFSVNLQAVGSVTNHGSYAHSFAIYLYDLQNLSSFGIVSDIDEVALIFMEFAFTPNDLLDDISKRAIYFYGKFYEC